MQKITRLTIGIDATNLRGGGGVTHLVELLRALHPAGLGVKRVVVWGGSSTLNALKYRSWLTKCNPEALNKGLLSRTAWQWFRLSQAARTEGCDVLFVPGGSFAGNFQPVVTMSQNLLPFEMSELRRYSWTLFALKLLLLRLTQSRSFRKAEGVIFLTEYACEAVLRVTGKLRGKTIIIPHGLSPRFNRSPKMQRDITEYNHSDPYRVLYVSIVDQYKHQWHVVKAVAILRKKGLPVVLDLVGPAYPPALLRLNATLDLVDLDRRWVHYHGAIPYEELHSMYSKVDMGIWASTCETFGIILLEAMASGLPIACSSKQPMPEVVGKAAVYFNPEKPDDIARALHALIESPRLRAELAQASYVRSQKYSWQRCASETFEFLNAVVKEYKGNN
ncbi:MAG: glycosyltransferase family 4 protein [Sulfuritalea sp.]|nr:glycosyltransferase family 4 protein [Sulfuritalea sp.]